MQELNDRIYSYRWCREFYKWQCFENVHPVVVMIAAVGDEIVGTFGVQIRPLAGGIRCGQVSWINIAEEWRGRGLFRRLADKVLLNGSELDAICIFANERAVGACERCLDMKFIGEFDRLTLSDIDVGATGAPAFCEEIDRGTSFDSIACLRDGFRFGHSQEFRLWRFGLSPVYTYFKVRLSSGEYAIVKILDDESSGRCCGDIVDFECDFEDGDKLRELFESAIEVLGGKGAKAVTTWANPDSILRAVVEKMGFAESGHKCHFGIKAMNRACEDLYDFGSWHVVQADATNY